MTSLVSRFAVASSSVMRTVGAALDSVGKGIEITKYTEKLVPSTRFVAVDGVAPSVSEKATFVAPSASVVGDVTIGPNSSVWYGATLRGDVNKLTIGKNSSIGDRAVVHVAKIQGDFATHIGDNVTIRAGALVHAATLKDFCVIGEAAQVLDGSIVESYSIVAPASIVTPGTTVASGELWGGVPAKKVRALTEQEIAEILTTATQTNALATMHAFESSKDYKQILEEEEALDIEEYLDDTSPRAPVKDPADVLGQGHPGRIFRSTLTHPEDAHKQESK